MGGSRAQVNKAHKTRFASKSSRNIHKTSLKGLLIFQFVLPNSLFLPSFFLFNIQPFIHLDFSRLRLCLYSFMN